MVAHLVPKGQMLVLVVYEREMEVVVHLKTGGYCGGVLISLLTAFQIHTAKERTFDATEDGQNAR
jgi:hypothetical protein